MKIIQVPFGFYPDPAGGTEVYVAALAQQLQQQGVEIIIAAPGEKNESYQHQSLSIRRFAVSNSIDNLQNLYGLGDSQAAINFSQILDSEQPDLVHLHAFTSAVSIRLVRAAKQRQIPVVFTYHTPTVSCQRGTLLQNGTQICDGKLELHTCTRCALEGMGMEDRQARLVGSLPPGIGQILGRVGLGGGAWTALRMSELVQCRQQAFNDLMAEVDHIVAVCDWVKDLLLHNNVPQSKITVCRQGLCHSLIPPAMKRDLDPATSLKLVFLGRLDRTKGVHLLIQALAEIPNLHVTLDIYGISQSSGRDLYQDDLVMLARTDARITFKPPIPSAQVIPTLLLYDLLVAPSQWLETGPLVVLEAFAAGIPVLGSRLGGIAELVKNGVNGVLVEASSVNAWAMAIQDLCLDRSKLAHIRSGISPPSTMKTVAEKMNFIYGLHLLGNELEST
jgi:glycosyltransferase involved in cell wall biosynthesis